MQTKTELLEEVANTVSMQQFVLINESETLTANDVYKIADSLNEAISKLLVVANKLENNR
jgi:ribosomal protein L10